MGINAHGPVRIDRVRDVIILSSGLVMFSAVLRSGTCLFFRSNLS